MTIELWRICVRPLAFLDKSDADAEPVTQLSPADEARLAIAVAALAKGHQGNPVRRDAAADRCLSSQAWTVLRAPDNHWRRERPADWRRTLHSIAAVIVRSVEAMLCRSDADASAFWRNMLNDFSWAFPTSFVFGLLDADQFVALVWNERRRRCLSILSQMPISYRSVRQRHRSGSAALFTETREYRTPVTWREILLTLWPPHLRDFVTEGDVRQFTSLVEAGRRRRTRHPIPSWMADTKSACPRRPRPSAMHGDISRASAPVLRRNEARVVRFR